MAKSFLKPVEAQVKFGQMDEKLIKFWKDNQIFEKSVSNRPADNPYIFYDGPPFVTGLPHYGHLLSSIVKDLIPRYQTMKGKRVRRVWGWDCHGLPIENKVEKKLGIKSRRDIEKVGLETFIKECYGYVSQISSEWDWYVDHVGRWVDMEHAYRTMDLPFMESVLWVFKQIYDKNLVYEGIRVSLYCPHCGTPISNFEVAMDNSYIDVTESATTYKYKLIGEDNTYILAWSTTPWNKLVTTALAVNPDLDYVKVKQGSEYYVLAKSTLKMLKQDKPYEIVETLKGKDLEGRYYDMHYNFFHIPPGKVQGIIVGGDFVTAEEGTGVVTLAVYGEEDFKIMNEKNIALTEHVDSEGYLTIEEDPWKGMYYLDANKAVNDDLAARGLIYRDDQLTHSVPVCWRCQTRLMFAPQNAWFIKISQLKPQLFKTNENIYWFPKHLKEGRFKKGIETAPDWCISRSRYWATPMPVWRCTAKGCSAEKVPGSIAEIEAWSGKKVNNLHRPYIDEFTFICDACGGVMKRIADVMDSWMDAGSMPYGERHYPFENKADFDASFPADFVVEYVAQTRAWFYVMHVISNALFGSEAFKNVICTGVIQGTDGRKMSKSYNNYPDPRRVLEEYGGDAFRLYLMSSPIMAAENLNINEGEIKEQMNRVLNILWNTYKYFVTYADLHSFDPSPTKPQETTVLDKWILLRLEELKRDTAKYFDEYNVPAAVRLLRPFIDDVSTWYIRRSRDRFVSGDSAALSTLYTVLCDLSLVMAPTTPFIAEEIYQNLVVNWQKSQVPESVHLCSWPQSLELTKEEKEFMQEMELVREVSSLGNAFRKERQLPLRQPLSKVIVTSQHKPLDEKLLEIIKDELNVKAVEWNVVSQTETTVDFDTIITPELVAEGEARKIIREIQEARKKAGTQLSDWVVVTLPDWPKSFEEEIKRKALVKEIRKGDTVEIVIS